MTIPRRTFVGTTARAATSAALSAMLPRTAWQAAEQHAPPRRSGCEGLSGDLGAPTLRDPAVKALAMSAVDAARRAGADYADVRISYTHERAVGGKVVQEAETLGLSVRALVHGYWGWAATAYVAASEAPRVAQAAVELAKGNAATKQPRHMEWVPIPVVADGNWTTPIREDPFVVAIPQVMDWCQGINEYVSDQHVERAFPYGLMSVSSGIKMLKQERVFASSEGSYLTQTTVVTEPSVAWQYLIQWKLWSVPIRRAQIGYEYVNETPWHDLIRQTMDRALEFMRHPLPLKPLDIGRYTVLVNAENMVPLVAETLGTAVQVDRALGYDANAGGTSYLGPDPLAFLGTPVASPLVTITADRTAPKALATTQWDEEGVRAEAFPLIQDGVLQDYQTTREQAGWLAPWYEKQGRPVRSHGCAAGADALTLQVQHMPNLTLQPGKEAVGLEELVASLDDGLVVEEPLDKGHGGVDMDFQALTGMALLGVVTKVKHGKRVARVMEGANMAIMVRSPELWKNVLAVGGPQSLESLYPMVSVKGEPEQQVEYSVSAVPTLFKELAVVKNGK